MGVNYGFDRARFLHPVRSGSRVRGRFLLTAVIRRSEREWQLSYDISVELLIRLLVRGQKIAKRMFESNCPPLEAIGVIFATRASQFSIQSFQEPVAVLWSRRINSRIRLALQSGGRHKC
jgi:hypothetical protein